MCLSRRESRGDGAVCDSQMECRRPCRRQDADKNQSHQKLHQQSPALEPWRVSRFAVRLPAIINSPESKRMLTQNGLNTTLFRQPLPVEIDIGHSEVSQKPLSMRRTTSAAWSGGTKTRPSACSNSSLLHWATPSQNFSSSRLKESRRRCAGCHGRSTVRWPKNLRRATATVKCRSAYSQRQESAATALSCF